MTKIGFKIPGVFTSAKPILAEQEKTFQLERIIHWKNGVESFKTIKLVLFNQAKFPIYSNSKITDRTYKAPTTQDYLDSYMTSTADSNSLRKYFLVTFGDQILKDKKLVYQIKGSYNGNASVYQ